MILIDEVVQYDGNTVWTKINSRLLNMEPDIYWQRFGIICLVKKDPRGKLTWTSFKKIKIQIERKTLKFTHQ